VAAAAKPEQDYCLFIVSSIFFKSGNIQFSRANNTGHFALTFVGALTHHDFVPDISSFHHFICSALQNPTMAAQMPPAPLTLNLA
jgi:hypothetical protein